MNIHKFCIVIYINVIIECVNVFYFHIAVRLKAFTPKIDVNTDVNKTLES